MVNGNLFLPVLLAASVASTPVEIRDSKIKWGPCDPALDGYRQADLPDAWNKLPYDCANLTVPLDYTDKNNTKTVVLELLRVPAPRGPSKGSVLFNFGGPGEPGRTGLLGQLAQSVIGTGYNHDLIAFDTRGTIDTMPVLCLNATEAEIALIQYPYLSNASDVAFPQIWAAAGIYNTICYERNKDIGAYVGTAAVARDLMSVVDALGEDGLLRYWGFSYGTVLGATVAAMFPDRMDKIVLDGNQNAHEYYHAYELDGITGSDVTWSGFFKGCAASPATCAIAQPNKTAAQLEADFYNFVWDLKQNPLTVGTRLIGYQEIKELIVFGIYSPKGWPDISLVLADLYNGNGTLLAGKLASATSANPAGGPAADPLSAIKCGDKMVRSKTAAEYAPNIALKYNASKLFGDVYETTDARCARWPFQAKEIYQGDFHVKTKSPILFVNNIYDPVTPLASAKNMSAGFEGSVLLQQNGYGHTSVSQPSICTYKAFQKYFASGELPAANTTCESDIPLFSGKDFPEIIPQLGGNP